MATIVRRSDGNPSKQWQAKIRRKGYPTQTKGFPTRALAEAWARSVEVELDRGHNVDLAVARDTTLNEVLLRYLAEVSPQQKGHNSSRFRLAQLARMRIAQYSLANITKRAVVAFRDERLRQVSPSTVNSEMAMMSRVVEQAIKEWDVYLPHNPFKAVRWPRPARPRDRRLEPGDEERLIAECSQYKGAHAKYLVPGVVLAIETGMRQGEILSLNWKNIDLAKQIAVLPDTKNGTQRVVPLSKRAVATLADMGAKQAGDVFCVENTTFRHAFMKCRDRAGLKDFRFHDLRHEATSRLFEKGLQVMEVAHVTGHKTLLMLHRYTHMRAIDIAKKLG